MLTLSWHAELFAVLKVCHDIAQGKDVKPRILHRAKEA